MKYTILETFVGAGGSHIGFSKQGFKTIFVNDISQHCMDTLLYNNPEIKKTAVISVEDITKLDPTKVLEDTKMKPGDLDVMFGGIVCKGFSLAGEKSPNDPRNNYYHYQLDLVKKFKPKISIIENVPAILSTEILKDDVPQEIRDQVDDLWQSLENYTGKKAYARKISSVTPELEEEGKELRKEKAKLLSEIKNGGYLISVRDDILSIYEKLGYRVKIKILNSAWYGSYTKRERAIIVAVRDDIKVDFEYPIPIYTNEKDFKTVGEALKLIDYSIDDPDNVPMHHGDKTLSRFKYLKEGENLAELTDSLPSELRISKFYSRGSTMRLDSKKCCPTLVPGHSNFPVHPFEDRVITVREAATITGFPLDYHFIGSHTERCEQVGNAVPPHLSTAIAGSCIALLNKYYSNN